MGWLMLGSSLFLNVVILVFCHLMLRDKEQSLRETNRMHREREITWEAERERLINRAMTQTWQDYTQMTTRMGVSSSTSDDEPRGMSDEEELRRLGLANIMGVGEEVLVDLHDDMRELGLVDG